MLKIHHLPTILVVDDERVLLELFEMLLTGEGYAVETVTNGRDALERVQARPPDLVISDFNMPEVSGWEVVQGIRTLSFGQHLPIILMSAGRTFPFILSELDQWTVFVEKPFTIDELLACVMRLLHV